MLSVLHFPIQKRRKEKKVHGGNFNFLFFQVYSILKHPVLDGAGAGVSRVRPGGEGRGEVLKGRKRRYRVSQEGRGQRDRKEDTRQEVETQRAVHHSCEPGQGGWTVLF